MIAAGIDEAGRGAVLGPLVLGGILCPNNKLHKLSNADSKALTSKQRAKTQATLDSDDSIRTAVSSIDAFTLSARMHSGESLDSITCHSAQRVAHQLANASPNSSALSLVCDAIGSVALHHQTEYAIGSVLPLGSSVSIFSSADTSHSVCATASVVAKTWRDAAIENLSQRIGTRIGSGYPSDKTTQAFLQEVAAMHTPTTDSDRLALEIVRTSWKSAKRLGIAPSSKEDLSGIENPTSL